MSRLRTRRARGGRDAGVASLELLGMVPLALIFAVIAMQVAAYMFAVTSANEAVRSGARTLSIQGYGGCDAARAVLSDSYRVECDESGGELGTGPRVRVVVDVPLAGAARGYVPDVEVTREAFLP